MRKFMGSSLIALLLLLGLIPAPSTAQQQRGPSTLEERAKAVRLAHSLETDPLAKDAEQSREWLLRWIIEIPDITVQVCTNFLGPLPKAKNSYSREIFSQMMFSSAAFVIQNPDKVNDQVAVNQAGLESALKAFEAIKQADPRAKWPYLDELIGKRNKGELADYVKQATAKCQSSGKSST